MSQALLELADELSALIDQFFVRSDEGQLTTLELDPEMVEKLRRLGYIK